MNKTKYRTTMIGIIIWNYQLSDTAIEIYHSLKPNLSNTVSLKSSQEENVIYFGKMNQEETQQACKALEKLGCTKLYHLQLGLVKPQLQHSKIPNYVLHWDEDVKQMQDFLDCTQDYLQRIIFNFYVDDNVGSMNDSECDLFSEDE